MYDYAATDLNDITVIKLEHLRLNMGVKINTLPETNIAPENGWLEY